MMRKSYATAFLLLLFLHPLLAQERGFALIRNYTPKEYNASPKTAAAVQNAKGLLFVGVDDGVLEYDGISWRPIPATKGMEVFDLGADKNGKIYVAANAEFGYLESGPNGSTAFRSLKPLLADTSFKPGPARSVKITSSKVYFQTYEGILEYAPEPESIRIFKNDTNGNFSGDFVFQDRYYTHLFKKGLMTVENGEMKPAPHSDFFKSKNRFKNALFYDKKTALIPTRSGEIYLYRPEDAAEPSLFEVADKDFFADNSLYLSYASPVGRFAFGSFKKGVLLLDKQGQVLRQFHEGNLLQNNNIYKVEADASQNMWFCLSNGISKAEHGLDLSYWDKSAGLKDRVESITRFDGTVYIATHQKVYFIAPDNSVQEVQGIPSGINWCLLEVKTAKALLAGTSFGIYEIKGGKAELVLKGNLTGKLFESEKYPGMVLAGHDGALLSLRKDQGKWLVDGPWEGIKGDIRGMAEDSSGDVWLGTYHNGAIRVSPDPENTLKPKKIRFYGLEEGFASVKSVLPFKFKGQIIWGTEKGLFVHNPKTDRFEPFCGLGKMFCDGSREIAALHETPDGKVWILPYDNAKTDAGYLNPNGKGGYEWLYAPFRRIPDMSLKALFIDSSGLAWIGGSEGVFRYDATQDDKPYGLKFHCLIRSVTMGEDSLLYAGGNYAEAANEADGKISYSQNSLKFRIAAPFFDQEEKTLYRFMLQGFDNRWSAWERATEKEYTNLHEGSYEFKAMAKNVYGIESEEAVYRFYIAAPWYRKWWAYGLYAVIAGLALIGAVRLNGKRLEKEKELLEKTVRLRTAEIEQQKNDIFAKNAELEQQKEEIVMQSENLLQQKEEIESIAENLKGANLEIQEAYQDIQVLSDIGQKITSSLDFDSILEIIYTNVNQLMPAEVFGIGLYDSEKQEIEYKLAVEKGQRYKPYTRDAKDKNQFPVWCIENQKEVFVNDVFEEYSIYINSYDDERAELADGTLSEVVESLVYLPLLLENRVTGIVTVQAFRKNAYTEQHRTMLRTLGAYISIAVENSKSYLLISAKNAQITDSIRYAKTIQEAILPNAKAMGAHLDYFVFFQPKDIVSGDFYWFAHLETDGRSLNFAAAVDCTGHGVPGAFMSMIGYSVLNEVVREKKITEPSQILEKLDAGVRLALRQEEKANEDGMDVALARIEKTPDGVLIASAGAKRSNYLFRDGAMEEIKGTKRSIGGLQLKHRDFEQEVIWVEAEANAILFLFTDGFGDQTNPENKKFGSPALIESLRQNAGLPCAEQGRLLSAGFNAFKGDAKQKDDVTVMGIRV